MAKGARGRGRQQVRFRILCAIFAVAAISLLYAAYEAYVWNPSLESEKRPVTGIADVPYSSCAVFGFPDAESFAVAKAKDPSTADELGRLPQDPPGCIDKLRRWMRSEPPAQINVYGRADRRQLSAEARKRVVSNEMLAHKRATAVASWITGVEELSSAAKDGKSSGDPDPLTELLVARTHVDVAGIRYASSKNGQPLELDRSVDIEAFWPRQLPINSAVPATSSVENRRALVGLRLNDEGMDPDVAVAVLALFVALSAYLATVGFFMRQRVSELRKQIRDVKIAVAEAELKNEKAIPERQTMMTKLKEGEVVTETHLKLLPIADVPMIVAALLLALHLFYFISTAWLRVSIVFATFAAMVLVMQHAAVWGKTVWRIFNPEPETSGSTIP